MKLNKVKSQDVNAYLAETRGLERDYIQELIRRGNAWKVTAIGACAVATIAVGSIAVLLPLKTTETVVLRVDNASGAVDVIPTVREKEVDITALEHKRLIKEYVELRNSYDWGIIEAYHNRLRLLSSGTAWNTYAAQFQGENPLHEKLRDQIQIEARVISITLLPKTGENYNAMVQLVTQKKDKDGNPIESPQYQTANLSYEIDPSFLDGQKEEVRLQNPLGFSVYGYSAVNQYEDKSVARAPQ